MVKLRRIVRDHQDAGSINSLIAVWGFVDDHTFITKAGHLGLVYRVAGVDYECLDQAQRRDIVHRFEASLRLLDETCRVYQYLCKRRIDPILASTGHRSIVDDAIRRHVDHLNGHRDDLYEVDLFLVLLYEGLPRHRHTSTRLEGAIRHPRRALREWLSTRTVATLLEGELNRALAQFHQKASAFEVQLADTVRPTRLTKMDAFRFLRRLVNYTRHKVEGAALQYDTHVDYFVSDCSVECHRDHLDVDGISVKVLTMKEPPGATFAHVLEGLYAISGEFVACTEWRRIPTDRMRRDLHRRRRHFFNKRVALVNYVAPEARPEEMLVDDSANATVKQLGDALTELDVNGHFFGESSLTIVLFDSNAEALEQASAEAIKVMAAHDGSFIEETYNLLNAWLSVVPGNTAHNLRRLALLETNYADLSFLFTLDTGDPRCPHLQREALAIFETRHRTPYHLALHVQDVGHMLVLGATGSGKSFLLNFLLTHAQKYSPLTVVFDLGHGYRKLATLLQGAHTELALSQPGVRINPFSLAPSPENIHFLHAFARVLLEGSDGYRLSEVEDREVYDAVENLYVLDASQRRLFTFANLLPRALAGRLSKWIEGGRYADLFDHQDDTLNMQRFQVFEFEAMRAYPELLEPLLFYVLHRVNASLARSSDLTVCVLDEAWRFIQHPTLRAYVEEALKTWRKRHAAMILATQSVDDFASADLLRTVIEGCPTKLLLANPACDRSQYGTLFHLNDTELDLLTELVPRRQLLLKRPTVAKVLSLDVDPRSYWLYTNTPVDNERVAAAFRECGFDAGLDRLAASA
ncbi:MAG: VirB4 family type IV secretion system protein [Vicinamibacterales bacterium]